MANVATPDPGAYWDRVYATRAPDEVSWFQRDPRLSLSMIEAAGAGPDEPVIDIGGGVSTLVDALLAAGHRAVTVLDISDKALAAARTRLGARAERVTWIVADVTRWRPDASYAVWHDRAAFHFLTDAGDRTAYLAALRAALRPGGAAIIAAFAADGPERCSGLPVRRYSPDMLAGEIGPEFLLIETADEDHVTPAGVRQHFMFCRFRRD